MNPSVPPPNHVEIEFRYAWDWFQYHASQRLTAFNFFLVLAGAVILGFSKAEELQSEALGISLGGIGVVVSVGFLLMDMRNLELVALGRRALARVEAQLPVELDIRSGDDDRDLLPQAILGTKAAQKSWWNNNPLTKALITHSMWLRLIMTGFGALSGLALFWAAAGY